jgi:hypothetical protein
MPKTHRLPTLTQDRVNEVCAALVAAGDKPTYRRVRQALGGYGTDTIAPFLRDWQARQQSATSPEAALPAELRALLERMRATEQIRAQQQLDESQAWLRHRYARRLLKVRERGRGRMRRAQELVSHASEQQRELVAYWQAQHDQLVQALADSRDAHAKVEEQLQRVAERTASNEQLLANWMRQSEIQAQAQVQRLQEYVASEQAKMAEQLNSAHQAALDRLALALGAKIEAQAKAAAFTHESISEQLRNGMDALRQASEQSLQRRIAPLELAMSSLAEVQQKAWRESNTNLAASVKTLGQMLSGLAEIRMLLPDSQGPGKDQD